MSLPVRRRWLPLALTLCWGIVAFALQVYVIFARPTGVPSNPLDRHPLPMPRAAGDAVLSQTFGLDVDGFDEITLFPAPLPATGNATPGSARVEFSLWDVTGAEQADAAGDGSSDGSTMPRLVHRATVDVRELTAHDRYTLRVQTLARSRGHRYRLDAAIAGTDGRTHVALLSVADAVYRGGVLQVNGRAEWGDLAFEVRATDDTPFRQFVAHAPLATWVPRAPALWLALLAGYTAGLVWTLARLIDRMSVPAPRRPRAAAREA